MGALANVQSWAKARWGTQLEAGWPNGQNRFVAMYARVPKSGIGARSYSQERMHARRGTQNPAGVPGGRRNDALSHAPASGGQAGGRNVQARLPLRSHIQGRGFHCMAALPGIP